MRACTADARAATCARTHPPSTSPTTKIKHRSSCRHKTSQLRSSSSPSRCCVALFSALGAPTSRDPPKCPAVARVPCHQSVNINWVLHKSTKKRHIQKKRAEIRGNKCVNVAPRVKSKTRCTYGRGGEEINDTTRHDYVSLELNTLRVGGKMEIRLVYKHTPFPPPLPPSLPPFGHPLFSLSPLLLLLALLHLPFLSPSPLSLHSSQIFLKLPFIVGSWGVI